MVQCAPAAAGDDAADTAASAANRLKTASRRRAGRPDILQRVSMVSSVSRCNVVTLGVSIRMSIPSMEAG
jgi:hypothetical protein